MILHMPDIAPHLSLFRDTLSSIIDHLLLPHPKNYHYVKEYILSGGKQTRPQLYMEACLLWGKKPSYEIAASIELVHAFLLIHDDIMDDDELRRDKPTLHTYFTKLFFSERTGRALALCFGDLLYSEAFHLCTQYSPKELTKEILSVLSEVITTTAQGQLLECASESLPTEAALLSFYEKKTAYYSIYLPLAIAALHSGRECTTDLLEFSKHLGKAHQLYDDCEEIAGRKIRKEDSKRCSDLMRLKMTPILRRTLDCLPDLAREEYMAKYLTQQTLTWNEEEVLQKVIREHHILSQMQEIVEKELAAGEAYLVPLGLQDSVLVQKLIQTYRSASQ